MDVTWDIWEIFLLGLKIFDVSLYKKPKHLGKISSNPGGKQNGRRLSPPTSRSYRGLLFISLDQHEKCPEKYLWIHWRKLSKLWGLKKKIEHELFIHIFNNIRVYCKAGQTGEKQDTSTVLQPTSTRMKINHGQTQGNHAPTSAGTGSPLQGNTEVACWCIQLSNFTAESGKGNRTHSLVWILIAQIYLPRVSRPGWSRHWAWQSEEEEERNSSELKSKSDFPKEQSLGSRRCICWGNLGADRCLAHVRAWGRTGNFVSWMSPAPIPLGGMKSCQQSWQKKKPPKQGMYHWRVK